MAREFKDFSVDELQGYYSDFHKDFYGHRPRGYATADQWNNKEYLVEQINVLHDRMDRMKSTAIGREFLRKQGWIIEEPEAIDPQEYAEWSADLDAQFYGEAQ